MQAHQCCFVSADSQHIWLSFILQILLVWYLLIKGKGLKGFRQQASAGFSTTNIGRV